MSGCGYHVGTCPECDGAGVPTVSSASTSIRGGRPSCHICGGLGIVRIAVRDIPIVRQTDEGYWELVDDVVTQLGDVAPG